VGLADAFGLETFHLVGHDWGATVAWATAASFAHRLRTLTAVSVPHPAAYGLALREEPDQQRRSAYIKALRSADAARRLSAAGAAGLRAMFGMELDAHRVDTYVRHLTEPGALDAVLGWYRCMRADFSRLPVVVPTTLVWSDNDRFVGRAAAEGCGRFVHTSYRFVKLTDATHWNPEERPEDLVLEITNQFGRSS